MSVSTESISKGVNTSTKNPILFVPALAPIVIHVLFLVLAYVVFPYSILGVVSAPNVGLIWLGYFLAALVGFIASCMIVDMANDSINGKPIDMRKSMNLVTGRLGNLILAALIVAVFDITFVLIPVAMFIVTIAIIEGTGAMESTTKAFDFVIKNLGEVIVYIILVIIVDAIFNFVLGLIPVVGGYIGAIAIWIANVIFTVASVHFYLALRQRAPPPPPPPPPPTT
jgi:hypothetical protein